MAGLEWLNLCTADGQENCLQAWQLAYLVGIVVLAGLLFIAARRSRDFSTAVIGLMPVAIAINIAVGAVAVALRLPIYLDSIGTVLVGVLAGPWAGALTGLLSNLIWALLPVPGGAGPIIAFFAPVAAVIGLMAGFWGKRGVFQLRAEDVRVGSFLALAVGIATTGLAFLAIQLVVGLPDLAIDAAASPELAEQLLANQVLFVTYALASVAIGVIAAWIARRVLFDFSAGDAPRIRGYLVLASSIATFVLVFAVIGVLFAWFANLAGDPNLGGLAGLALTGTTALVVQAAIALLAAVAVWYWARRGDNARLFPVWVAGVTTGLVAAAMSAPIAAGFFGGVTGAGTDLLVSLYRTLGLNVFTSVFAQGLTSDPLDKTISFTVVFLIITALPISLRLMFSRGESTVAD